MTTVPICPQCGSQEWNRDEQCQAKRTLIITNRGKIKGNEWGEDDCWSGFGWQCANGHDAPDGDLYETLNDLVDGY